MSDGKLNQIRARECKQRHRSALEFFGVALAILVVVTALVIAFRSIAFTAR